MPRRADADAAFRHAISRFAIIAARCLRHVTLFLPRRQRYAIDARCQQRRLLAIEARRAACHTPALCRARYRDADAAAATTRYQRHYMYTAMMRYYAADDAPLMPPAAFSLDIRYVEDFRLRRAALTPCRCLRRYADAAPLPR